MQTQTDHVGPSRLPAALGPLLAALVLLTRLPVPRLDWSGDLHRRSAPWLSVAGVIIGILGGLIWLLAALLWSPLVAAVVTVLALVLITGALHEDGFADTLDASGSRGGPERALEIMRDSRIGTYGVIGLVGVFSLRVAVLAAEVVFAQVLMLLVLAHGAGRFSSLIALELPPARSEGMGHGMAAQPVSQIRRGAFLMLGLCLVLGPTALAAWFLAALVGLLCHWYWQEWVGGVTGDLAGATAIISEIAIILLVAAWPEAYRCWFWGLVA